MASENRHTLQDVFRTKEEYQKYLKSAYGFLRGLKKGTNCSIVPSYLEIRLSTKINNQRIFLHKKSGDTLIVELPIKKNIDPRKRGAIKTRALIVYGPLLATYEKAIADELAIAGKLISVN